MLSVVTACLSILLNRSVVVCDLTNLKAEAESSQTARELAWDQLHALSALQGQVNRRDAKLYFQFVGDSGKTDQFWFARLRSTWLKSASIETTVKPEDLIRQFRSAIKGVVVWDPNVPATSNVASTVAGVEDLLPIRFDLQPNSLYRRWVLDVDGPQLPVKRWLIHPDGSAMFTGKGVIAETNLQSSGSSKCDAYLWAVEKYLKPGKCSGGLMGYYPDATWIKTPRDIPLERTLLTNHDFFIAKRGFFFDLSPWDDEAPDDDLGQPLGADLATLKTILLKEYQLQKGKFTHVGGFTPWDQKYTDFTKRKHGGVETEWRYAEILTSFNAYMDADAPGLHAMANASVFMHEPLKARYLQAKLPTDQDLIVRGFLNNDGTVVPKPYATFYVGDYDSAAWLYTMMPQLWEDPNRGTVPLGWAFNPALAARFPTGMAYARETATANDFFVSGDSGFGYVNPGYLDERKRWSGLPSGLAEWEKLNERGARQWDLGIVGFVIDGNAPPMNDATKEVYARFSPWGVVAQKIPLLSQVHDVPFLQMSSDLPHDGTPNAAAIVIENCHQDILNFLIFRTILWSPTEHAALLKQVQAKRPDITFVDPYTLMRLAKLSLKKQASGQKTRF